MYSLYLLAFPLTAAALMWCVVVALYNRYFHPLAHVSGPFWGSVSEFYRFLVLKSIPIIGPRLHRQYGPVVRIAPNLVMFNDPQLLPKVYHRKAEKTAWYTSWMWEDGVQAMFLTPKYDEHAMKKKIVGPVCSLKALKRFEDRFDARVDELCCTFQQRSAVKGEPVDFAEWLRLFLWDTFTHLAYGKPAGCVSHGKDLGDNIQALQNTYSVAASVALLPWLFLPIVQSRFVQRFVLPYTLYGKGMSQLSMNYQSCRRSQSLQNNANGFLDRIEMQMSPEEVRAEHITFTAATLDGVAAFISPFLDNMIQHPRVLAKVVAELDDAERRATLSKPVAKFDEIAALPYFQACIMENLRRDAPAQTLLPRIVPEQGVQCGDGLFIPSGAEMAASPYIIHRDSEVFGADPEDFWPERWLQDPIKVSRMLKHGMWWGYGERKCAGEHYAQLEMQKLCFELLRRFEITSASPEKPYHHEKWAVGMYWHQWVQFSTRDGPDT